MACNCTDSILSNCSNEDLLALAGIISSLGCGPLGTNLTYMPSPEGGTISSSTGTPAFIPLANETDAGLLSPDLYNQILTAHPAVTISTPANGLSITASQVLSLALSSSTSTGALSSTDWNTFNNKVSALAGTPNYLPKFTSPNTLGDSQFYDNGIDAGVFGNVLTHYNGYKSFTIGNGVQIPLLSFRGPYNNGNGFEISQSASGYTFVGSNGNVMNFILSPTGDTMFGSAVDNGIDRVQINGSLLSQGLRYTKAFQLPSSTNLDTISDAGFYDGSFLGNAPNGDWGFLTVERHSNGPNVVHQTFTTMGIFGAGIPNKIYSRIVKNSGGAGTTSWVEFEYQSNKQNSMVLDGTGIKYPTVDAVNIQTNNLARATMNIGLLDVRDDAFNMTRVDDFTLGITGTSIGVVFPNLFDTPPYVPSDAIKHVPTQNYPLQNFLSYLPTAGTQGVFYIGWRDTTQTIELSTTSFIQNPNVFQMGIIYLKNVGGTISFIDANRTVLVMPDVSQYSNLETTAIGVSTGMSIAPNNNLTIRNIASSIIGISVNYKGANNDELPIAAANPTTFTRLSPADANAVVLPAPTTGVNTVDYYNPVTGLMTPLGAASHATVQRWLLTVRGTFILQPGEEFFTSFNDAKNAVFTVNFTDFLPKGTFVEIARMATIRNVVDLSNPADAAFFATGKGGGGVASPSTVSFVQIQGFPEDNTNLKASLDAKVAGSGTVNYLSKFTGTSTLGNSIVYENLNGIGINTTNPSTPGAGIKGITLNHPSGFSGAVNYTINDVVKMVTYVTGDNNLLFQASAGVGLRMTVAGGEIFKVNSNGNFQIGPAITDNGIDKLQVNGSIGAIKGRFQNPSGDSVEISNTGTNSGINLANTAGGTGVYLTNTSSGIGYFVNNNGTGYGQYLNNWSTGVASFIQNNSSGPAFIINNVTAATGKPFTYTKNGVEKVVIYDSGEGYFPKLGVGTGIPSYMGDGTLGFLNAFGESIVMGGSNGGFKLFSSGGTNYINSGNGPSFDSKGDLAFTSFNNGTEWMRLKTNGNFLINTQTDNGIDKLQVNGSILSQGLRYTKAIRLSVGTDLNTITDAGFYDGGQLINAPDGGYIYVNIERAFGADSYVKQTATAFGAGGTNNFPGGTTWIRTRENGNWTAWQKLLTTASGSGISGSGTTGFLPKFTSSNALGNSLFFENGNAIGVGTTTPQDLGGGAKWLNIDSTGIYGGGIISRINGAQKAYFTSDDNSAIIWGRNISFTSGGGGTPYMYLTEGGRLILSSNPAALVSNLSTFVIAGNEVPTGYSYSALDISQTWNTDGNPTAIKLNITNTASGINSLLMDLQLGGQSLFKVRSNGNVSLGVVNDSGDRLQVNGTMNIMMPYATGEKSRIGNFAFTNDWQGMISYVGLDRIAFQSGNQDTFFQGKIYAYPGLYLSNAYIEASAVIGSSAQGAKIYGYDGIQFDNRAFYNAPTTWTINGAEKMRLTPGGNFLIGTATDNGVDKLQVNGSTNTYGLKYTFGLEISSQDLNNITTAGFYTGASLGNSPLGSGNEFFITVERYIYSVDYVHQTATAFGSGPLAGNRIFTRCKVGGVWQPWAELITTATGAGSGTPGYLAKFSTGNTLVNSRVAEDANYVYLDTTGVYIRGENPNLTLRGDAVTHYPTMNFEGINGTSSIFSYQGSFYFNTRGYVFRINGADKMYLNGNGNLLINTSTDNGVDNLQVNGSAIVNKLRLNQGYGSNTVRIAMGDLSANTTPTGITFGDVYGLAGNLYIKGAQYYEGIGGAGSNGQDKRSLTGLGLDFDRGDNTFNAGYDFNSVYGAYGKTSLTSTGYQYGSKLSTSTGYANVHPDMYQGGLYTISDYGNFHGTQFFHDANGQLFARGHVNGNVWNKFVWQGVPTLLVNTLTDNGVDKLQVNGTANITSYIKTQESIIFNQVHSAGYNPGIVWNNTTTASGSLIAHAYLNAAADYGQSWLYGAYQTGNPAGQRLKRINGYRPSRLAMSVHMGGLVYQIGSPGAADSDITDMTTVFMVNTNNGNVLLNTTTDNGIDKLQVNGSGVFTLGASLGFRIGPSSSIVGAGIQSFSAKPIVINEAGNPTIINPQVSNVLIGTYTDNGSDKLQVYGSSSFKPSLNSEFKIGSSSLIVDAIRLQSFAGKPLIINELGNSTIINPGISNVLIGTTTDNGIDKLQVNGSILSQGLKHTKGINVDGTDLNNLTTAGFYTGEALTNAPTVPPSGIYHITVERREEGGGFVHQTATSAGYLNTPNKVYSRTQAFSSWSAWTELLTSVGGGITGSGTVTRIPVFTASGTLGNSSISENSPNVNIDNRNLNVGGTDVFIKILQSGNPLVVIGPETIGLGGLATDTAIFAYNPGDLNLWTGGVRRISIKNNGNVLIGTTTDNGYKLQVNGTTNITGSLLGNDWIAAGSIAGGIFIQPANLSISMAAVTVLSRSGANLYLGSNQDTIVFNTAGTDRGRFTYGGNLLINTATDDGYNRLQVNGPGRFFDRILVHGSNISEFDYDIKVASHRIGRGGGNGATNLVVGDSGLTLNTTGAWHTAIGGGALYGTNGYGNTAVGYESLTGITNGNYNVAVGLWAGKNLNDKGTLLTSCDNSVFLGENTSALGQGQTNQIVIGFGAKGLGSNSSVLGNDAITKTGLYGRVLIGTSTLPTDNGVDQLQINGSQSIQGGDGDNVALRVKGGNGRMRIRPFFNSNYGTLIDSINNTENGFLPITLLASKVYIENANLLIGNIVDNGVDKLQVNGSGLFTTGLRYTQGYNVGAIDLNTLQLAGFYSCYSNAANTPIVGSTDWYITVQNGYNQGNYTHQVATTLNSLANRTFSRVKFGGTWSSWQEIITTNSSVNGRITLTATGNAAVTGISNAEGIIGISSGSGGAGVYAQSTHVDGVGAIVQNTAGGVIAKFVGATEDTYIDYGGVITATGLRHGKNVNCTGQDLNTLNIAGFYGGEELVNCPLQEAFVEVQVDSEGSILQIARPLYPSDVNNPPTYMRIFYITWGAWKLQSGGATSGTFSGSITTSPAGLGTVTITNQVYTRIGNVVTATIGFAMSTTDNTSRSYTVTLPLAVTRSSSTQKLIGICTLNGGLTQKTETINSTSATTGTVIFFKATTGSETFACSATYQYEI